MLSLRAKNVAALTKRYRLEGLAALAALGDDERPAPSNPHRRLRTAQATIKAAVNDR